MIQIDSRQLGDYEVKCCIAPMLINSNHHNQPICAAWPVLCPGVEIAIVKHGCKIGKPWCRGTSVIGP